VQANSTADSSKVGRVPVGPFTISLNGANFGANSTVNFGVPLTTTLVSATGLKTIPSTSTDQYGATMAKWFGVGAAIPQVVPNIGNFPTADVGFMG